MKLNIWGILLLFVFILSACQSQSGLYTSGDLISLPKAINDFNLNNSLLGDLNNIESSQNIAQESTLIGINGFPDEVNPLTGQVVEDPSILNRRPVFTKISNFPAIEGRPHAGLSYADIVFEYYIGEWMNRFLAVYYSQDVEEAWPLRSGRLVDAQLAKMYQGVLAYGNADERVDAVLERELGDRAIAFLESPCPPICGELTHSATGVSVNTAELSNFATRIGVDNSRYNLDGMLFSETPPVSDQYGVWISVQYIRWNRGDWYYNAETHLYDHWIESWESGDEYPMIPLIDKLNGQQVSFANIIIIFANYVEYATTLHDIDIWDNTEGQRALIFRDGIAIDGYWRTQDQEHPIQFFDKWGLPVALRPGNTWIVIAGNSSGVEQPGDGQWRILFDIP